ncbi:MAG: hypothetical protein AAGB12_04390 [Pseudomonadota bacterium]
MDRMIIVGKIINFFSYILPLILLGCATRPPDDLDNICGIFWHETDWYEAAVEASEKWKVPIHVMMAIIHQESRFIDDARPKRSRLLWVIPWTRPSSAYGYAQALDEVWGEYQDATDNHGADRDDFDDAIDFIGWYAARTYRTLGISKWDARNQYLAYHEGMGGYKRKTYRSKSWLINVASRVKSRSSMYYQQLQTCKAQLDDEVSGWFF